jgi:phage gpG-like protein
MNLQDFSRLLAQKRKELDRLMRRTLPVKVGAMAKAHYQDNIRVRQGFLNGGVQPWPKTRRQLSGGQGAAANYGPLLSGRKHLYSSIQYTPSDYRVVVANDLKYAPVHNWGGTTSPTVTAKMRKFAWAMYYQTAGKKKTGKKIREKAQAENARLDTEANKWKALALTRKSKLNIRIPQRQFLGESKKLDEQVRQTMDSEVRNILNKE